MQRVCHHWSWTDVTLCADLYGYRSCIPKTSILGVQTPQKESVTTMKFALFAELKLPFSLIMFRHCNRYFHDNAFWMHILGDFDDWRNFVAKLCHQDLCTFLLFFLDWKSGSAIFFCFLNVRWRCLVLPLSLAIRVILFNECSCPRSYYSDMLSREGLRCFEGYLSECLSNKTSKPWFSPGVNLTAFSSSSDFS